MKSRMAARGKFKAKMIRNNIHFCYTQISTNKTSLRTSYYSNNLASVCRSSVGCRKAIFGPFF